MIGEGIVMMIGYSIFAVLTSIICSTIPAVIIPLASKTCRVTTIGVSVGISTIIGSFIPLVNELIKNASSMPLSPSFLIMATALVSFVSLFILNKKESVNAVK